MVIANHRETFAASDRARRRLLSVRGEPLFLADWYRVLMFHFEVDASAMQREVPFDLDLYDNRAFVSLVAFTMRGMRPRLGGIFSAWLFRPIATHEFLNVRTYVRHGDETGIHFLAEWLSNRLAVKLGPRAFGLPYRWGRISYQHEWRTGELSGSVEDVETKTSFKYRPSLETGTVFEPCAAESLDEWLMERYTALNCVRRTKKLFRVWHPPWPQGRVDVESISTELLTENWPWFREARFLFANFSPGLHDVWMGRPHQIK
jgi:uncharacterized protein